MASEGTHFFLKTESCFYTRTFKMLLMLVCGCSDKPLPAGCPGRGAEDLHGAKPCLLAASAGAGHASCLQLPPTSFGTLPQSSNTSGQRICWYFAPTLPSSMGYYFFLDSQSVVRSFLFRFCLMNILRWSVNLGQVSPLGENTD